MRTKFLSLAVIALLAIGLTAAVACGDGDHDDSGGIEEATSDDQTSVSGPGAGAIVPNTFLTYQGAQYRLSAILQADLEDESQFSEAGEATEADIDGDLTVFNKDGDTESVYTFWQDSGSGDTATPSWYRWEPAD